MISFNPGLSASVTPCDRIQFIQVLQIFIDGVAVDPGDFYAGWQYRDPTALDDDPATDEDETGTHVDRLPGMSTIFYGGNGPGTGYSFPWSPNGPGPEAQMEDDPTIPDNWFQPGGVDRDGTPGPPPIPGGNDWNADTITFKFEACAFCECGDDAGEFFESMTWELTRTRADVAAGWPGHATITGVGAGPSDSFLAAVEQWCDSHSYDPTADC